MSDVSRCGCCGEAYEPWLGAEHCQVCSMMGEWCTEFGAAIKRFLLQIEVRRLRLRTVNSARRWARANAAGDWWALDDASREFNESLDRFVELALERS